MSKRIGMYVRVETEENACNKLSINEQIEMLTQYANAHDENIYDVYIDHCSGNSPIEDRAGLQRLFKDAEGDHLEKVIVSKINRVSRSVSGFFDIINSLEKNKVSFASTSENIDTSNPMGKLMLSMLNSVHEIEQSYHE